MRKGFVAELSRVELFWPIGNEPLSEFALFQTRIPVRSAPWLVGQQAWVWAWIAAAEQLCWRDGERVVVFLLEVEVG